LGALGREVHSQSGIKGLIQFAQCSTYITRNRPDIDWYRTDYVMHLQTSCLGDKE